MKEQKNSQLIKWFTSIAICTLSLNGLANLTASHVGELGSQGLCHFDQEANQLSSALCPSLNSFQKGFHLNMNFFSTHSHFNSLGRLVTGNQYTQREVQYQEVDLTPASEQRLSLNGFVTWGEYQISAYLLAPIHNLVSLHSPAPDSPQLLQNSNHHLLFKANISRKFENLAISVGATQGFKGQVQSLLVTALDESSSPSYVDIQADVESQWAMDLELAYQFNERNLLVLHYQQKMDYRVQQTAQGISPLGSLSRVDYQFTLEGSALFSPENYRISYQYQAQSFYLLTGIRYERWSDWQGPSLQISQAQGVLRAGDNYQYSRFKDILIPSFAIAYPLTNKQKLTLGYSYRPSILTASPTHDRGNRLDTNVSQIGLSYQKQLSSLAGSQLTIGASHQHFHSLRVDKQSIMEDGSEGEPIGSPGYELKGSVLVIGAGLALNF